MFVPPVGSGVDICDGSSEVNIVPEEGERTYFWFIVERRAWVKPGLVFYLTLAWDFFLYI